MQIHKVQTAQVSPLMVQLSSLIRESMTQSTMAVGALLWATILHFGAIAVSRRGLEDVYLLCALDVLSRTVTLVGAVGLYLLWGTTKAKLLLPTCGAIVVPVLGFLSIETLWPGFVAPHLSDTVAGILYQLRLPAIALGSRWFVQRSVSNTVWAATAILSVGAVLTTVDLPTDVVAAEDGVTAPPIGLAASFVITAGVLFLGLYGAGISALERAVHMSDNVCIFGRLLQLSVGLWFGSWLHVFADWGMVSTIGLFRHMTFAGVIVAITSALCMYAMFAVLIRSDSLVYSFTVAAAAAIVDETVCEVDAEAACNWLNHLAFPLVIFACILFAKDKHLYRANLLP